MARDRASRPEARPLRLFVAVDVPPRVVAELRRTLAPLADRVPGARWTRPESWHVTLKFLGSTWPRLLDQVRGSVAAAAAECRPFASALTEIGAFPSARRARVLWAGLSDPEGRLAALARRLDDLLRPVVPPEKRAFTAHLTLARLRSPVDLDAAVPGLAGRSVPSAPFVVDRLVLYRSHLSRAGASYEPLLSGPFAAAGGEEDAGPEPAG